jgi:hypothetical protein
MMQKLLAAAEQQRWAAQIFGYDRSSVLLVGIQSSKI